MDIRERLAKHEGKHQDNTKNEKSPERGGTSHSKAASQATANPNAEQVMSFIASTMETLENFKKQFAQN